VTGDALPAVIVPSGPNAGLRLASLSSEVSARGPESRVTSLSGTISAASFSAAATALRRLASAILSCRVRAISPLLARDLHVLAHAEARRRLAEGGAIGPAQPLHAAGDAGADAPAREVRLAALGYDGAVSDRFAASRIDLMALDQPAHRLRREGERAEAGERLAGFYERRTRARNDGNSGSTHESSRLTAKGLCPLKVISPVRFAMKAIPITPETSF
jgi:hypothetical protein